MNALDILENVLSGQGPDGVRRPLHEAAAESVAGLIEFASVRHAWWINHRQDLLNVLPGSGFRWEHLPRPDQGLVLPFVDENREVHEVPSLGAGWEAGAPFMAFQERFKSTLVKAGAVPAFALMVLGAFNEMASNASEHSEAQLAPVASYEVADGRWTFSVTDVGCGLLKSLRSNPSYAELPDEAAAIRLAIKDGVSATGRPGRGFGFTKVFQALVDRMCLIRFRSAGAAASWSGRSPAAHQLSIAISPPRGGFHVQVGGSLRTA